MLASTFHFANDYGDAVNGKDTEARQGPQRAVQSGAISASSMRNAVILFSVVSLVSGIGQLYEALKDGTWQSFLAFLGLGILAIIAAITYTRSISPSTSITRPLYADLAVTGGWLYLSGGSQGIIVYRSGPSDFTALDRHCPYQSQNLCKVVVDSSQVIARDTACCGSAFLINDGSVVQGPAALNLQRYSTSFNGSILRIYNN